MIDPYPDLTPMVAAFSRYVEGVTSGDCSPGGVELSNDPLPEEVTIYRLRSSSLLSVALVVGGYSVNAIVDTAAEVTIISDRILGRLCPSPEKMREVLVHAAGRDMRMKGIVVGPVSIRLGTREFSEDLYVAPIEDDMLLGVDFLHKHGVNIHIRQSRLQLGKEFIPMEFGEGPGQGRVARVYLSKSAVIPPNHVKLVSCIMDQRMGDFIFEPVSTLSVLAPSVIHDGGNGMKLYVINPTDRNIRLNVSELLGEAQELGTEGDSDIVSFPAVHQLTTEENENENFPSYLEGLYERSSVLLAEDEQAKLRQLLVKFADVFARDDFDFGSFTAIEHPIDTGSAAPVKLKMRRTPLSFAKEEKAHLEKMLDAGIIRPSISEWASAPVLIRKRDGGVRWCIDYRALNDVTRKDVYPLPNIEECLDTLTGNAWFSKLDANSAYYQVKIQEEARRKTAFTTKYGLYEFVRMGFGLCNAPATFSRAMDLVLRGLNWEIVLAFLDDVVVLGATVADHLENLETVLKRFVQYGLKLKPKKCVLFQEKIEFLGREVSANRVQLKGEHVRAVLEWPTPENTKQVEQFLGLVNYHRVFIKDYAAAAVPLYRITGKHAFCWGVEQQEAFEDIKRRLTRAPVLTMPNSRDLFILDTDASNDAIGAELLQLQEGEERVIAYGSSALTSEQRRYCVTRRELLAVVRFTRQYRHYLLGRQFVVRTDHSSLTWLLSFKYPQGQLARWMEELSQYDLRVEHRPGKMHANADAMSRIPEDMAVCEEYRAGFDLEDLPCGGCGYCIKAHRHWASFLEDVDYVVPLAYRPKVFRAVAAAGTIDVVSGFPLEPDGVVVPTYRAQVVTTEDVVPLPNASLRIEQGKDAQLSHLRDWLVDQLEPEKATIMLWGPAEKYLWINRNVFHMVDGVICKRVNDQEYLVVPQSLRDEVLCANHDIPSAGHAGRDRTVARIKDRYFWYNMHQDIKEYVRTCSICNHCKKSARYGHSPMKLYHAGVPMERVHLDFLGPLPKSSRGNVYILMMVDQFTKWVECIPLPSQTAEETARAAVGEFFTRFGYPLAVFTDQGRNFESRLFQGLCKSLMIHKAKTTPYRPSANGQVERYNRTLMDAIRCFIGKAQNRWDEFLPQIAGALRTTVNRSTGFTANRLMLGREVNQPADLLYPVPGLAVPIEADEYQARLRKATEEAHEVARKKLRSTQKRLKRDYDVHTFRRQYNKGDLVYVLDSATLKGVCKKLSPPWKGPARIAERLSPDLYRVELRNMISTRHQDRLKPCTDRGAPTWCSTKKQVQRTEVYCLCRKPDDGNFMIQCDRCEEWYHGKCVDVSPSEGEAMDKYYCPSCRAKGPGGVE